MKQVNMWFSVIVLLLAILYAGGCDDSDVPDLPTGDNETTSASNVIGESGGRIRFKDTYGCTILLVIPYGALDNGTTVTVTSLGQRFENQVASNIVPGITIEPTDLLLRYPALLEVHIPDAEKNEVVLYCITDENLLMPLAEQSLIQGAGTIGGELYYFGRYAVGIPTEQEMISQIKNAKQIWNISSRSNSIHTYDSGDCPPGDYGWQGMSTEVAGILYWGGRFSLLGNDAAAQEAQDLIENEVERSIESFLKQDLPKDLCGAYARAAFQYYSSASLVGAATDDLQSLIDQLYNQCSARFQVVVDYEYNNPEPGEIEETSRYGTVTCYIPYEEFISSIDGATVKGDGQVEYSSDYSWEYNSGQGWKKTRKQNGSGTIACTGSTSLVSANGVYPADSYVWKAYIILTYEEAGTLEACDTKYDEYPEQDSCIEEEYTKEWFESYSATINAAGAILEEWHVDNPDTGETSDFVATLQWKQYPGFKSSDDGKCY